MENSDNLRKFSLPPLELSTSKKLRLEIFHLNAHLCSTYTRDGNGSYGWRYVMQLFTTMQFISILRSASDIMHYFHYHYVFCPVNLSAPGPTSCSWLRQLKCSNFSVWRIERRWYRQPIAEGIINLYDWTSFAYCERYYIWWWGE